ncbi:MAG: hydroxymethylbilane synthase [Flavisolibacter sp.]
MTQHTIRIGTRESQLAVWQASLVQDLLKKLNIVSELVYIKSEGDIDTVTPLYAIGVQGIFTKTLDAALLNNKIDIAVHSMKDVPTQLAKGIVQAAVLKRASHKDILVYRDEAVGRQLSAVGDQQSVIANPLIIGTSSIRRIAQWLHRFPGHKIENLRGNVNTRLRKLQESNWDGAVFAAAGLERIGLRPKKSIDLDWMLPAPAQGAIMIVCKENDNYAIESCQLLNDEPTALCTKIERDFLKTLMGGCSTPISALAEIKDNMLQMKGNVVNPDGSSMVDIECKSPINESNNLGVFAANDILKRGGQNIVESIRKKGVM